mmetsp:Transcript_23772/g.81221  ORF Transcript_23772/g.81221 Transcript_23772/m.81221 type:complete len:154 (+) Transcript_23772:609-1070(+)
MAVVGDVAAGVREAIEHRADNDRRVPPRCINDVLDDSHALSAAARLWTPVAAESPRSRTSLRPGLTERVRSALGARSDASGWRATAASSPTVRQCDVPRCAQAHRRRHQSRRPGAAFDGDVRHASPAQQHETLQSSESARPDLELARRTPSRA